jgi:thiol-disulfide isomerase/thioredoxin
MDQLVVTIYSRPGCHLCDEMKALVERVAEHLPLKIEAVDISTDRRLEELYGLEIPVLMVDGRKAAKYRIGEDQLLTLLRRRVEGLGRPTD